MKDGQALQNSLSSSVQSQLYDSILGVITGNYEPKDALAKIDEKMNY